MAGKEQRRNDKKGISSKIRKLWGVLLIVLLLLFVPVGGSLFLLSMDKYHDCYQNFIIDHYLKGNNYYDGTAWLSVTATLIGALISAVPGLVCGILAMVQTQRLHRLEARFHRPALEIENVELSFARLDHIYKNDKWFLEGFDMRQRFSVNQARNQSSAWWVDLKADLFLNNEIAVRDMKIESVTFSFLQAFPDEDSNEDSGKEYKLSLLPPSHNATVIRSFERKLKNGHAAYTLLCGLNPFVLETSDKEADFNESIDQFAYYGDGRDPGFWRMNLSVAMKISYDYMEQDPEPCLLRVAFEADAEANSTEKKAFQPNRNIIQKQSANGYITYEV
ncbi:MAG: hypothetical protein HDR06_04475 [Lachnospiraceae bacterium]|nr:hypothetical protein [Lachnospiraceae bacterium]